MMKFSTIFLAVVLSTFCFSLNVQTLNAQSENTSSGADLIDAKELDGMIKRIGELVESKYINAEMGSKMSGQILANHRDGKYTGLTFDALGTQLREDFIEISSDVHMNAFYSEPREIPRKSLLGEKVDGWGAPSNFGFVEFKVSRDNIGYLKIGHFGKWKFFEEQKRTATMCIRMLENTNAIVIDVRGNPGGFEDIVAYVMSHFFDQEPFDLQEYYCRYEDRSRKISTSNVPGKKLPNIPIYILVNKDTGSAAESLAYMMKHLGRATVIGEKTVGAGNGSTYFNVTDRFRLQVATWETINAKTKTSWEKTGVIPDIEVESDGADEKALELAKVAGEKFRTEENERLGAMLERLEQAIASHSDANSDDELMEALSTCQKNRLYEEARLNNLGYSLLGERNLPRTAEVVLKMNTLFYPDSANVYDSYGEVLAANEKNVEARSAFEKAVAIGKETNHESLDLFVKNLAKLQEPKQ